MIAKNTSPLFIFRRMRSMFGILGTRHCIFKVLLLLIMMGCSSCLRAQVCSTAAQSESSQVAGDALNPYAAVNYTMTVRDTSGDNFDGRTLTEGDYKTGSDSCWFSGNTIGMTSTDAVNGSSWQVNASNQYGFDTVGWTLAAVQYISELMLQPTE